MKRIIQPELLDTLPPDDPGAVRSRRDLCRLNAWMRHHAIMAGELKKNLNGCASRHITELGAGDGNFFLRVAQLVSFGRLEAGVRLLDLQANVTPETLAAFASSGCKTELVVADVFDEPLHDCDVIIANLFLHHFEESRLRKLFHTITQRARLFIAIEPRRSAWPLFCSRLLWAIGCNGVTRHDAAVSVRAGFNGRELSALWPAGNHWQLAEQNAGLFSHLFVARKID